MKIEVISKEKLTDYKHLMLSYIYEELESYDDDLDCEYICLAATVPNEDGIIIPVSVLICLMEPFGDIAVLSIYTLPADRRQGYALNFWTRLFLSHGGFSYLKKVKTKKTLI